MSNAIVDNGIIANGAYANLTSSMDATLYVQALIKEDFTTEQAEAFAGVEKTGEVVNGVEQYKFITKDKVDANGNIVYDNDGKAVQERTQGYSIEATYTDPATGYSGVLFKDNVTEKYTIANRGTEMTSPEDLGDDVTLYNQQVPEQFASLSTFMQQLIDSGTIKTTDDITMSGHSLGGALTQMGTVTFSDYIDQAYTYNSPGVENLMTYVSVENGKYYYQEFTGHYDNATGVPIFSNKYEISQTVYDAFYTFARNKDNADIASKLLNIKASDGNSVIADLGTDIGSELSVSGSSHSIVDLIKTLSLLGDDLLSGLLGNTIGKYTIVTKESIEGLIGTDAEAWNAFLKANPWLQVADDYLLFDYSKKLIFPEDILPETSAGEGHNENFSSPLVLDLNGDGTTSTFIAQTNTYFDMDGDGFRERTSWTENSDGLLTLDLNNDGKVTNGSELFGNNTKLANGTNAKDGFEALSQYDLNKDNVIDSKDSIYSHLKVWIDSNSDGISTADELKTLQELNITSIDLNTKETSTSEAYNQISDSSTFTQNGQTKILFTCKHFTTLKSLHVRNKIQHKGANSGEEIKVA